MSARTHAHHGVIAVWANIARKIARLGADADSIGLKDITPQQTVPNVPPKIWKIVRSAPGRFHRRNRIVWLD